MPTVINPDSGTAQELDPAGTAQALQAGWHIPLVDKNGDPYSAPYDEAHELVQSGEYRQTSPAENQHLVEYGHYSSPLEQAKTFIEGAGEAIAGPLSSTGENALFGNRQEQLKRSQYNPGIHTAGELAGTVGGVALLPEASVAGLISGAGEKAATAVALTGSFGKIAQAVTRGAIEGGLYTANHQISEAVMGNPNATAEHVLANVGLGAVLGAGGSLIFSPISSAVDTAIGKARGLFGSSFDSAESAGNPTTFEDVLPNTGIGPEEKENVLSGLRELKPNAQDIIDAGKVLGVEPNAGQLSSNRAVQEHYSALSQDSTTWPGLAVQNEVRQGYKAAANAIDDALGANSGMTKTEVGNKIQEGLITKLQTESQPINDLYSKVQAMGKIVPIEPSEVENISKSLLKMPELTNAEGSPLSPTSEEYRFVSRISDEMKNITSVDDARRYAQTLNRDVQGKWNLRYINGQVQAKLSELQDNATKSMIDNLRDDSPLKPELSNLFDQHLAAKAKYAALREKMDDLGSVVGKKLRKGEGVTAFTDWLSDQPPEKIADKLFTKNNSNFLNMLQDNYPDEFNLLTKLKKSQLREAATENGEVNPSKVLREYGKLEPEIQSKLFNPSDLAKIDAANTFLEAMPKNVNPSGTAKTLQLFDFLKNPLSTGVANAAAQAKRSIINSLVKSSPGEAPMITAIMHLGEMSAKSARAIDRYAGGLFGRGVTSLIKEPDDNGQATEPIKMNRLGLLVMNHSSNPDGLIDHLNQVVSPIRDYAPQTADAITTTVAQQINFLQSKLPKTGQAAPLDEPNQPSNTEISDFNKYAEIANKPTNVLHYVKNGTVTPQDIESLSNMVPSVYEAMKYAVQEKMTNYLSKNSVSSIPYRTRLGLSLFLGQNLDSTLTPQSIAGNQVLLAGIGMEKAMQEAQPKTRVSKTGISKMKSFANDETLAQRAAQRRTIK